MLGATLSRQFSLASVFGASKGIAINRDAASFPEQSIRWTYKELDFQIRAYALGLKEIGFKSGNTMALWISQQQSAEAVVLSLACYRLGINVHGVLGEAQFESACDKANGLVFSPLTALDSDPNKKRVDAVIRKYPQMREAALGEPTSCNLTQIIHTGFFTIRGALKLKQIPVYAQESSAVLKEQAATFSGSDVTGKAKSLLKDLGIGQTDYVVNAVDPMVAGGFAGSLAALLADSPMCYTGSAPNPADVAKIQNASVFIHDDTTQISASTLPAHTVKNLVVVGASQGEAETVARTLQDKAKVTSEKVTFVSKS